VRMQAHVQRLQRLEAQRGLQADSLMQAFEAMGTCHLLVVAHAVCAGVVPLRLPRLLREEVQGWLAHADRTLLAAAIAPYQVYMGGTHEPC